MSKSTKARACARRPALEASIVSLGTLLGAALSSAPAVAQEASPTQRAGALEEVVVTANRRVERNIDVPVAVTAVAAQDIENLTAGYMTDIGLKVPNVFMSQGSISPSISIRGVSSQSNVNAGFPPAVGVYVDEVYQGRDPTFNTILNDVTRIEVLRGPQGTLYGKNTIGGAINIVTQDPTTEPTLFGDLNFGNIGLQQLRVTAGAPIADEKLMARVSVVARERDGWLDNGFNGGELNDLSSRGARLVTLSKFGEDTQVRLSADWFREKGTSALETDALVTPPPVPAALAALPPQSASDNEVQLNSPEFAQRELWGAAARISHSFGSSELTSITAYREYESSFHDDSDGLSLDAFDVGREENAKNYSQELRLTSTGDGPLSWIVGAFYYVEDVENFRDIRLGPQMPVLLIGGMIPGFAGESAQTDSTIDADSWAGFATVSYKLTERLTLQAGARYTNESKDFSYRQFYTQTLIPGGLLIGNFAVAIPQTNEKYEQGEWTGDVSLSFAFDPDRVGYVKASRGFKAGGFQTDVISPPFDPADPLGFDPEFVDAYELGFKSYWLDRRLSLNAAAFYLDWDDKQEQVFTGLSFLIRNAAKATSQGVELELVARATDNLTLDANFAWLQAEYDEFEGNPSVVGKQFAGTPETSGSVGIQYVRPIAGNLQLYARVDTIYIGSTYSKPNAATTFNFDSSTLFNGRLGLQSQDGRWGAYLWGKNVGDERDVGGGSIFPFPRAQISTRGAALGRIWGIELRKSF